MEIITMSHFKNLTDFFAMGGYADYVWSAYAIVVVVLLLQLFLTWREARTVRQRIIKNNLQESEMSALMSTASPTWPVQAETEGL